MWIVLYMIVLFFLAPFVGWFIANYVWNKYRGDKP